MWKVKDIKNNNRWKRALIGLITIAVIVALIGVYIIRFATVEYALDYAFLKCMAVLGGWFISFAVLGFVIRN